MVGLGYFIFFGIFMLVSLADALIRKNPLSMIAAMIQAANLGAWGIINLLHHINWL